MPYRESWKCEVCGEPYGYLGRFLEKIGFVKHSHREFQYIAFYEIFKGKNLFSEFAEIKVRNFSEAHELNGAKINLRKLKEI